MISRLLFRIGTFFIGAAIALKVIATILALAFVVLMLILS